MVPAILKNICLIEVKKYLLQKELNVDKPVQSLGVSLLQGEAALVDVLEDVVLADGEEVVHCHDVVHGLGQDPHLDQSQLGIESADQSQLSIESADQSQLSIDTADQ